MELQIPYRICAKVSAAGGISANQGRYRKDNQAAMRDEESGNHRGRSMPGSYPYVSEHTAKYQRMSSKTIKENGGMVDFEKIRKNKIHLKKKIASNHKLKYFVKY